MVKAKELNKSKNNHTKCVSTKKKASGIPKWIFLRSSICSDCKSHSLATAFVHAVDSDTGKMSEDEVDDYFCTVPGCKCGGKLMGHYTKYCTRCKKSSEISDDEIDNF